MSEFSESYHLREASQEDAVQLLRRAGLNGIVFPSGNHWTSFVPIGRDWEGCKAIVQANRGTLLHYSYGEDHGLTIEVYQHTERQIFFEHSWDISFDEEFSRPPNNIDFDLLAQWTSQSSEDIEALQQCLATDEQDRAYDFAHLIGLEHFRWLSPSYLTHDLSGHLKPGAIKV